MKYRGTNNWSKAENGRRYKLHRIIKKAFLYSAKGRVIHCDEYSLSLCSPKENRAMVELRDRFKYNIQYNIPDHFVGMKVRLNPKYQTVKPANLTFEILRISGTFATIKPLTGRWKKERRVFKFYLIPV